MEKGKQTYKLPEGWAINSLGDIALVNMGQSPPSSSYNTQKNGLPFYQGKSEFGDIHPTVKKFCSEPIKIVDIDDVLISVRAPIGPTNIVKDKSCIGRGLAGIKAFAGMSGKFLLYQLRTLEKELQEKGTGTTFKSISKSTLEQTQFKIPPLLEQQRIVSKIESLFSELDQAEKGLLKAKKQLEVYRQALLKSAFEGKLTEGWRKANNTELAIDLFESIRSEQKRYYQYEFECWKEAIKKWEKESVKSAKPKKPKGKQSVSKLSPKEIKKLPQLPDKWKWVKLGEVCLKIMDGTHFSPKNIEKGSYKYITAKNILEGRIDLTNISYVSEEDHKTIYKRCDVTEGDILYVKDGAKTGRAAVNSLKEEFSLLSSVGVFRTFQDKIRPKFLEYYLNAEITRKRMLSQVAGVAITRLTLTKLNNSVFSLCSMMEQDQIVKILESRFTLIENLEKSIEFSLKDTNLFKHSILKKAFEGRLVNQNSNDESAKELLQRIEKEKAEYLKAQKALDKLKPKKKRQMEKKKTVLEILKESNEPISTQELWTNSIHDGDIESFYSEIKEIHDKLDEVKESTESLLSLKK